jgi:hypothetical protein
MIKEIKLSEQFSVYKFNYENSFNKNVLLERAYQAIKLNKTHKSDKDNFFYVTFRCPEFELINDLIIKECRKISEIYRDEYAVQNWIYKMTSNTNAEIFHTHNDLIEGDGRIETDWTFCLYIQIPTNIDNDEGKICFLDEKKKEHLFLPCEGDIFLFPANLLHTPKLTKRAEIDRIVYAGNISLQPLKKINDKNII